MNFKWLNLELNTILTNLGSKDAEFCLVSDEKKYSFKSFWEKSYSYLSNVKYFL